MLEFILMIMWLMTVVGGVYVGVKTYNTDYIITLLALYFLVAVITILLADYHSVYLALSSIIIWLPIYVLILTRRKRPRPLNERNLLKLIEQTPSKVSEVNTESLISLLTKEYEVKINRDLDDNSKDTVWVVDLYNYATDNDDATFRGLTSQSLQDLLVNICKELYSKKGEENREC